MAIIAIIIVAFLVHVFLNKIYAKLTYPERKEQPMYDYKSVREAIINAIVHNDWSNEYPPKFEFFSDRLEISSFGGKISLVLYSSFLVELKMHYGLSFWEEF